MTTPDPTPHSTPAPSTGPTPGMAAYERNLRRGILIALAYGVVVTAVAALVGHAVAGTPGLVGGLAGGAVGLLFAATTAVIAYATRRASDSVAGAATLGGWLAKMVLLFGVLILVREALTVSAPVLLITLIVVVIGMTGIEAVLMTRRRIPLDVAAAPGADDLAEDDPDGPRQGRAPGG